jgi:uncharacterized protein (TIGR03435 family)
VPSLTKPGLPCRNYITAHSFPLEPTLKLANVLFLSLLMAGAAHAQDSGLNPDLPKLGTPAPPLTFTQLLQAPTGTNLDRPALKGKVVVLEFWAMWCAPCVAEIPILNSLVASLDPAKVQFIAVDDEDPALVEAFLKKKPISGWVGLDTTGKLYERYGVNSRPTTIVIDPQGRVVSTTVRPENLKREQLLAVAEGKPVTLGGPADPKMQAELHAAIAKAFAEEVPETKDSGKQVFEIGLSVADPVKDGKEPDTHIMQGGPGQLDITNASPQLLLQFGAGVASTRITTEGDLPKTLYNLHVKAPGGNAKQLASAIELAVASGAGLHIEHRSETKDAFVLTAKPEGKDHFKATPYPGFAGYDSKTNRLQCINATGDQLAVALEKAFHKSVVNETGLPGKATVTLQIDPKAFDSAIDVLEKGLGVTLISAKRPIETVVLSPAPAAVEKPAPEPK